MWYWQQRLEILKSPCQRFLNQEQAAKVLEDASTASAKGELAALRSPCRRAWALQPPDQVEAAKEQAAQSGLKGG